MDHSVPGGALQNAGGSSAGRLRAGNPGTVANANTGIRLRLGGRDCDDDSDGELATRLTHPRYGHEKEYRVLVARRPDDEQLETWRRGVVLEDGYRTAPAEISLDGYFGKATWLRVVLREGRKRQLRETGLQIGLPVVKIIRVRIGSLRLGTLKPREWRRLTEDEVAELKGKPVHKPKTSPAKPYTDAKKPWTKPGSPK